jgi:hypothetical protein
VVLPFLKYYFFFSFLEKEKLTRYDIPSLFFSIVCSFCNRLATKHPGFGRIFLLIKTKKVSMYF